MDNGYAIRINDEVVFTKKLNLELSGKATVSPPGTPVPEAVLSPVTKDKKEVWNQFIADAEIPHRVKSPDGGVYTVRQYSPKIAAQLVRIINTPGVDYKRLVESTKNYYKTVNYKSLLSNYIDKEIWKGEYDNWKGPGKSDTNIIWED